MKVFKKIGETQRGDKYKNLQSIISVCLCFSFDLHLLVLGAAKTTQLSVGVKISVLDEAGQREPEFVIGNQLQPVSVLPELVVGNTSNDVENKQRQQAIIS